MRKKYKIIFLIITFITLLSCKKDKVSIDEDIKLVTKFKKQNDTTQPLGVKLKNEYSMTILKEISSIRNSEFLEPNGGVNYKKNDKTIFIEILEEMKTNKKSVDYTISFYDNNSDRNLTTYGFYLDNKNLIIFMAYHFYKYDKSKAEDKDIVKDTFFFKNNKIYFWKNKQATKEELLKKGKEILAIKKEIDSVMEW